MILELNEVLLEGDERTLSLMAEKGHVTCLAGGSTERRRRWLYAMLGFVPVSHGYISIDGEPLTERSTIAFRQLMALAPSQLRNEGEISVYEPPTIQDVFSLKANRSQPISNGILGEEVRRIGADPTSQQTQLLAVAVLLNKPILLVDHPQPEAMDYLHHQAQQGKLVIVVSDHPDVLAASDTIVEL